MTTEKLLKNLQAQLSERKTKAEHRSLVYISEIQAPYIIKNKRKLLNFASNDYMGLSSHPHVKTCARDFLEKFGTGTCSSRLITGSFEIHKEIEDRIARLLKKSSCLLFNSGFQANSSIISTLFTKDSLLFCDRLIHRSLVEGAKASNIIRFRHQDFGHLQELLEKHKESASIKCIITESLFSMGGDLTDISGLQALAGHYQAILYVDEAHSIGCFGEHGFGIAETLNDSHLVFGTMSKALGSYGAFLTCSALIKEYLINFCPGFIYSTSLPPPILGAITGALDLLPSMGEERKKLQEKGSWLRKELQTMGFDTGNSSTHIIPLIIGSSEKALVLCSELEEAGLYVTAIRPPSVEPKKSSIRICLSSLHTEIHLAILLAELKKHLIQLL